VKLLQRLYRLRGEKVKKLGRMLEKCPRLNTKGGSIKSITPTPKNGPDAAVPEPEAATQGSKKMGALQGLGRKSTHLQGEPHVPGCLE
jgi:hypothetical protein